MIRLTVDQVRRLKDLTLFAEPVEISDNNGNLIGLFVPGNLEIGKQFHAQLAAQPDTPPRRPPTEKGYTTREVFERLQTLTQDPEILADLQRNINILAERDRCDAQ